MEDDEECCPKIYSVHLWNNLGRDGVNPDVDFGLADFEGPLQEGEDRRIDLSNWDERGQKGKGNFDFGFYDDETGLYISASHLHNPDLNGDGVGDYWAGETKEDGTPYEIKSATVYFSTPDVWELKSRTTYNEEFFCVQCSDSPLE